MSAYRDRLLALRTLMKKQRLSALIVPRQDEFQGEYVASYAERLKWLTGFSGSWGMAIIREKEAHLFVDGRYTVQVREQTDSKLFNYHHLVEEPPSKWIAQHMAKGQRVGFDPWLTTIADAEKLAAACKQLGAILVPTLANLIDEIWEDQPTKPGNPISNHPIAFAGITTDEKLSALRQELAKADAAAVVIAEPSSVAWLYNIRGADIPYTPVVPAYSIVKRKGKAEIFIEPRKVLDDVSKALADHVTFRRPEEIHKALKALGQKAGKLLVDPHSAPDGVRLALLKSKAKLVHGIDPCTMPKATKNKVEQEGARQAHLRDGIAMVHFLHWLEQESAETELDEGAVAGQLRKCREASNMLADQSFETIPASGPNAAIPHYHADPHYPRKLLQNEIFLIDSGGQYHDGTTDITRTVIIGQPTDEMRDRFTRVLKGMIQVSVARFPAGTIGTQIDAFARNALWKAGLDYDHGTGHGVGSYLSVHEGPARISKTGTVPLQPGMLLSNEPGYYKPGSYGIRIENLLLVTPPSRPENGDRDMLGFETLTLCPIDRKLIETRLLTREELEWLDGYHARVWRELRPHVDGPLANWLTKACAPLR